MKRAISQPGMAEIGIKEQEESKKLQENIKKSQTQQETEQRGGSA